MEERKERREWDIDRRRSEVHGVELKRQGN